jgi:hypothetical protein
MSFVSANDHPTPVSPHDPLYYAPPSLRNKADPRSKEVQQMDHTICLPLLCVSF